MPIPEEGHDRSVKINDECFVDSWVLAKLESIKDREQFDDDLAQNNAQKTEPG